MPKARKMALCAVSAALCVTIMLAGRLVYVGMYAAPIAAGVCLCPAGRACGVKWQLLCALASALLCFLLISDVEQNLMFLCLFSWYPALRPVLQKRPPALRIACKGLLFNGVVVPLEWLIVRILVPQSMTHGLAAALLVLGNAAFFAYDAVLPRAQELLLRLLRRAFPTL